MTPKIQANELRIGNWVFDKEAKKYTTITCIEESRVSTKDGVLPYTPYEEIQPIPLTPEILEKAGFVLDKTNGTYWLNLAHNYLELLPASGHWYPTYAECPEFSHLTEQRVSLNLIDYLHQLQNLYFAITGEELTINL